MKIELFSALIDQLESSVSAAGGRKGLRNWISTNLAHPKDSNKSWSFDKHEFQIGILDDLSPWIAVQKAAQIGMSELSLSIALGLLSVLPNSQIIYALQTAGFAKKFSQTRLDPAIDKSKRLQALRDKDVDSTELKKIGSSYLHIVGASAENQAISVPASALIVDEISFANPAVVGALASRLEHLEEREKTVYNLSTPLYSSMGITEVYEAGSQNQYMVYHDSCGTWTTVSPLTDIVIPGFDEELKNLETRHLREKSVDVDAAYVKCPHCGNEISRQNLADPSRRAWVPRFTERVGKIGVPSSYQVTPLDLAGIKSVPQIIRSIELYKKTDKWIQYGLGFPFDSADGMILPQAIDRAFVGKEVRPESPDKIYSCCLGIDIGKTSHLTIAKKVDNKLHFLFFEKFTIGGDGATPGLIQDRWLRYSVYKGVADHGPDVRLIKELKQLLPIGGFFSGYFTRGGAKRLDTYEVKESEGTVAISRTRAIDEFTKEFNRGNIVLPANTIYRKEIVKHLQNLKRISNLDNAGEEQGQWIALNPETHWLFSMLYAYVASEMMESDSKIIVLPTSGGLIGRARVGVNATQARKYA